MRTGFIYAYACGIAALAAACGGGSSPCDGVTGKCVAISDGASRADIQTAMINATDGTTIAFPAGKFTLDGELDLDVPGVTVLGAGMGSDASTDTILTWKGAASGAQGLYVTSDRFTAQDIAFEDAPGDILKIEGAAGVTLERVRAEYTNGPATTNGSYAIYPVQCSQVHVDSSFARGASDTGIYVGQSDNIVLEHNEVAGNVSGIEIENSTRADVHDNNSHDNTGGILVFNLPGLQVHNGHGTRVYNNNIHDNNQDNFAPTGNIVGKVPKGTGIAILAAHTVEVFGNTIANHDSVNLGIISYQTLGVAWTDTMFDPDPDTIDIHDNTFTGTANMPTGELGALLILALSEVETGSVVVPDMVWDGVVPALKADPADANELKPELNICMRNNGDADFANLRWPNGDALKADFDLSKHDCAHTPIPPVVLQ